VGVLAHPLTPSTALPVPPLVLTVAAVAVAGVLARLAPVGRAGREADAAPVRPWVLAEQLPPAVLAARVVGVALLVLAVAAGRLGAPDQLDNLAPALIVGLGWPLLVLACALLGDVWGWLDPWDSLARVVAPAGDDDAGGGGDVRWALPGALAWVWYLAAFPATLEPRAVGAALAVYTIATLAACLSVGRLRWLTRGEVFGILFAWLALLPRRRLRAWTPPRGAAALLGVLAGGLVFAEVRTSPLWGVRNAAPGALLQASVALAACALLGATLLVAGERWARARGASGSVTAAAVPLVGGIAVALSLTSSRLFTSLQVLPGVATDPFGRGWDPLGVADTRIDPNPLGAAGLVFAQVAVLVLAAAAGAVVGRRRGPGALGAVLTVVGSLLGVAVLLVTAA
jgi:hypothetical protein